MKIEVDTHTHSTASLHAYSTITELAKGARKNRLKGFVLSEHGPAIHGGYPHPYFFGNLHALPDVIEKVRVFHGVELNITDSEGGVDLSAKYLRKLDLVMAGLHEAAFPPQNLIENTDALIQAIANPYVDGITHPGNPAYPVDFEAVVKAAVRYDKFLEINNGSFRFRRGSEPNCKKIVLLAKRFGCYLTAASDAHYWTDVGNLKKSIEVIKEADVHRDQVINNSYIFFCKYIEMRKSIRAGIV